MPPRRWFWAEPRGSTILFSHWKQRTHDSTGLGGSTRCGRRHLRRRRHDPDSRVFRRTPDTTAVTAAATTAPGDAPTTPQPTTPQPTATTVEPNSTTRFEEADCRFSVTVARGSVRLSAVPADRTDPARRVPAPRGHLSSDDPSLSQTPSSISRGAPEATPWKRFPSPSRPASGLTWQTATWSCSTSAGRRPRALARLPRSEAARLRAARRCARPEEYVARQIEAVEACRDRLQGEGIDLSPFDSASSSADVADLGRALDYDRWNRISYGTRLALTVMRITQITSAASSSTRPTPRSMPSPGSPGTPSGHSTSCSTPVRLTTLALRPIPTWPAASTPLSPRSTRSR